MNTRTRFAVLALTFSLFGAAVVGVTPAAAAPAPEAGAASVVAGVDDSPASTEARAARPQRSVMDCISVARNTFNVTRGNLWAAIGAVQSIPGCSSTISNSICWTSRQWWGSAARWVVSQITSGRYNRC